MRDRFGCGISSRGQEETALRDQAGCRQQPQHPVKADAVADRGQKISQRIVVPDRLAATNLFRRKGLCHRGSQAKGINAETGIHLVHALGKQRNDAGRVAHRAGETDLDL